MQNFKKFKASLSTFIASPDSTQKVKNKSKLGVNLNNRPSDILSAMMEQGRSPTLKKSKNKKTLKINNNHSVGTNSQ